MPAADLIYIRDLKIETCIGVHAWEQRIKQVITLDIDVAHDIKRAARSANISDSIDYTKLANAVCEFITNKAFVLLETLVEQLAEFLLQEFQLSWIKLRVGKPGAVPGAKEVGIIVERNR